MAFWDSLKRRSVADGNEVKTYSKPIANVNSGDMYSRQRDHQTDTNQTADHVGMRPFKLAFNPVPVRRAVRVPRRVPAVGETVHAKHSGIALCLKKALMTDHVSVTYVTDREGLYVKIYTIDVLQLDMLENKAKRMLREKVQIPGICWPVDIIDDTEGCFLGILVPASRGVQLTRSVLKGATGLAHFFPKWNKRDLCELAVTILGKAQKMHELGIMFGCINPASIYIASTKEVYFVDTDCWQIEGYPALSRNQTFSTPELLQSNKAQLMYTMDQENYQMAVLTFMLMMPGKFPYAKGKNANERDSIIDMAFPFSVGGGMRRSQDAERPSGIWRIVWDHLPYQLCDSFYNTFHSEGKYARPGTRLRTAEWLKMTRDFANALSNPGREESCDLLPRTFRRDGKRTFVRCSVCGQEHPDFYFIHSIHVQQEKVNIWERGYRICLPCANDQSDMSFQCECCGRKFYYTNRTKVLHEIGKSDFDFKKQRWCRECKKRTVKCRQCGQEVPIYQIHEFEDRLRKQRMSVCGKCFKELVDKSKQEKAWKNSVARRIQCRNCGKSFSITNGDIEYYNKKGYNMPTRCPNCRKKHN